MKADLIFAALAVTLLLIAVAVVRSAIRRDRRDSLMDLAEAVREHYYAGLDHCNQCYAKWEQAEADAQAEAARCSQPPCQPEDGWCCDYHAQRARTTARPAGRHRRKQYQTGNGVIHAEVTDLTKWPQP